MEAVVFHFDLKKFFRQKKRINYFELKKFFYILIALTSDDVKNAACCLEMGVDDSFASGVY